MPVLPVVVAGTAVSPGNSTCSLVRLPAVTVIAGLTFVRAVLSKSVAVTVQLPTVRFVKVKVRVPEARLASAGKVALGSVEESRMV